MSEVQKPTLAFLYCDSLGRVIAPKRYVKARDFHPKEESFEEYTEREFGFVFV